MIAFLIIAFGIGAVIAGCSYRYGWAMGRRDTNRQWQQAVGSLSGILKERASDG